MLKKLLQAGTLFAALFIVSCSPKMAVPEGTVRSAKETFLFKMDTASAIHSGITLSKDLRRVMYSIKENGKQMVVADGVRMQAFREVSSMMFSEDAKHIVYVAREGDHSKIMWDEKERTVTAPGETIPYLFWASPNSNLSYLLRSGNKTYMFFRGNKTGGYDEINPNSIAVTPNGKKVAFTATKGNKSVIVMQGKETPAYDEIGFPIIRKNGRHLVYWAKNNGKAFVVADGHKGKEYDKITSLIVNEEGDRYAYSAQVDGKEIVVSNDTESEKYIYVHSLLFSPGSSRLMYAFESVTKDKEGFNQHVMLDGIPTPAYETVVEESLYFSPDGLHSLFEAEIHDQFFVVTDGKQGPHVSDVLQATIKISPTNRVAYAAENNLSRFVIADDKEGIAAKEVFTVGFSPDSKRLLYSVLARDNKEYIIADGKEGPAFDNILAQGGFFFDGNSAFHYLATRGRALYLVEEVWR